MSVIRMSIKAEVISGSNSVDVVDRPDSSYDAGACRNLIASIVRQAISDWKAGNDAVHEWLTGPVAERYVELIGIDPDAFREGLARLGKDL